MQIRSTSAGNALSGRGKIFFVRIGTSEGYEEDFSRDDRYRRDPARRSRHQAQNWDGIAGNAAAMEEPGKATWNTAKPMAGRIIIFPCTSNMDISGAGADSD